MTRRKNRPTSALETQLERMRDILNVMDADATKSDAGNRSAGIRLRNKLRDLRVLAKETLDMSLGMDRKNSDENTT